MEEMEKKSGLAILLNLTNILGLAVIISLAVVIKILLDQKVTVQKENKSLLTQIEEKSVQLEDLNAVKSDLNTKLTDLQKNQGCDSYIKQLNTTKKSLAKAKSENYKILKTFQDQSDRLRHLSEKAKILEGFIDEDTDFPLN